MCINKKRFYNKWAHSWQWIDCGKCPACLQAKANKRTRRIKDAVYDGYITLFVTLTYRNINIPYIRKDELTENCSKINIYRDCSVRRVRFKSDYEIAYKYQRDRSIVASVDCFKNRIFPDQKSISKLTKLKGQSDREKVGVLFFKDVQDFEKRLRTNLARHYGVTDPIYTFKCSEYGPSTLRPHFHLLISGKKENLAELQSAIIESWPFDSRIKSSQSIQIARNAASYVSSYVNRGSDFPVFLDNKIFRPKHSFSLGYGTTFAGYSLQSLLHAVERGDLRYDPNTFGVKSVNTNVFYPKYAYYRYFAKFYGYSRLSYDEIVHLVVDPWGYFNTSDLLPRFYRRVLKKDHHNTTLINSLTNDYEYDFPRMESVIRQIIRQRSRFLRDFVYYEDGVKYVGLPENEYTYRLYADTLYKFWKVYHATLIKMQYDGVLCEDLRYVHENYVEVYDKHFRSDILEHTIGSDIRLLKNPNLFPRNINDSLSLTKMFKDRFKRRKITNRVMANQFNV